MIRSVWRGFSEETAWVGKRHHRCFSIRFRCLVDLEKQSGCCEGQGCCSIIAGRGNGRHCFRGRECADGCVPLALATTFVGMGDLICGVLFDRSRAVLWLLSSVKGGEAGADDGAEVRVISKKTLRSNILHLEIQTVTTQNFLQSRWLLVLFKVGYDAFHDCICSTLSKGIARQFLLFYSI